MREIDVVKTPKGLRGWTEEDQAAYARMKKRIEALQPGEFARVGFTVPRHGKFHRKFFKMLTVAYEAWEPMNLRRRSTYKGIAIAKNFERFRKDILILAGFGEPTFDVKGRMKLEAKSIAYDEMEQPEFEQVYSAVADVLLGQPFMARYNRAELDRVVDRLMEFT